MMSNIREMLVEEIKQQSLKMFEVNKRNVVAQNKILFTCKK